MAVQDNVIVERVEIEDATATGARSAIASMDRVADKSEKMSGTVSRSSSAFAAFDKASASATNSLNRLRAQADPTVAAMQRLERAERDLDRAIKQGLTDEREKIRLLDQLSAKYGATANATAAFGRSQVAANQNSARFGNAVQQAGFQVGDFAVQVASGQGVLRPFIQQGTQLVSMFGPWGAVIGAAGAVVGALATSLWDLDDAASTSEMGIASLGEELDSLGESAAETRLKIFALEHGISDMGEARAVAALRQETAQLVALQNDLANLQQGPGYYADRDLIQGQIEDQQKAVESAQQEIDTYRDLTARLGELEAARDKETKALKESSKASDRVQKQIDSAIGSIEEQVVANQNKILLFGEEDAVLKRVSAQQKVANILFEENVRLSEAQADRLTVLLDQYEEGERRLALLNEQKKIENELLKDGEALTKSMRDEHQIYADQIDEIRRLLEAGTISQETFNRAVGEAEEEYRKAQIANDAFLKAVDSAIGQIQDNFQELFTDIFENGLNGAEDFADGILNIFERLAAQLATQFVIGDILGLGQPSGLLGIASSASSVSTLISGDSVLGSLLGSSSGASSGSPLLSGASTFGQGFLNAAGIELPSLGSIFGGASSTATTPAVGLSGGAGEIAATGAPGAIAGPSAAALGAIFAPLAIGALGIVSAFLKPDPPTSIAGIDAVDGRFGIGSIVTENDGDPAVAQALGDSATSIANALLDAVGGRLSDGAQLGSIGQAYRGFGTAFEGGLLGQRRSSLGIRGMPSDSRFFENTEDGARAAAVDFVARSTIKQIQDGALQGVSDAASNTLKIGLGNITRTLEEGLSEEAFNDALADINFLATFDDLVDGLASTANAATDAAQRLEMARESQEAYNASLADIRAQAAVSASESPAALAGLGDYIDRAERLFDPTGGQRFQIRLALSEGSDGFNDITRFWQTAQEVPGENGIPGRFGSAFGGVGATGRNDDMLDPNMIAALGEEIALLDEQLGQNGRLRAAFRRHVDDLEFNLNDLATILEDAGVEVDAVIDDFFTPDDRERVAESLRVAKAQVDDYFNGIGDAVSGPIALFEQITPSVSPLITSLEGMKAQIEANRPELEALNEDLARYGATVIDVNGKISAAIATVTEGTQDQFLASLGIAVGNDGQIREAAVDFNSIATVAETIKGLDTNAAELFSNDPRGLLSQVQTEIDARLIDGLNNILSDAEDFDTTMEQITLIFGDRLDGLNLIADQQANQSIDHAAVARAMAVAQEAVNDSLQERIDLLNDERSEMERLADTARSLGNSLRGAANGLLTDQSLSPFSLEDQLAEARSQVTGAFNLANDNTPLDEASLNAAGELPDLVRTMLELSRAYNASNDNYLEDFNRGQEILNSTADRALSIEAQQLSAMQSIDAQMADLNAQIGANQNSSTYVQGGDGQYVTTGLNGVAAGIDLGANPDDNLLIYRALNAAGINIGGFGEGQLNSLRQSNATASEILRVMGYADGGLHPGGLRLVGENGPELEVTGPSRIFSNEQTVSMLRGGGDLVSELQALRGEVAGLRADNARLQSRLVQVTAGGSLEVTKAVQEGNTQRGRMLSESTVDRAAPMPRKVG